MAATTSYRYPYVAPATGATRAQQRLAEYDTGRGDISRLSGGEYATAIQMRSRLLQAVLDEQAHTTAAKTVKPDPLATPGPYASAPAPSPVATAATPAAPTPPLAVTAPEQQVQDTTTQANERARTLIPGLEVPGETPEQRRARLALLARQRGLLTGVSGALPGLGEVGRRTLGAPSVAYRTTLGGLS